MRELVDSHLGLVRTELGRFGRQVSGYSLEHLLPERGRDLAKTLVGTEGTCGIVLGATVRLVDLAPATALAVLGYPDMAAAADAVPALLPHGPLAVEGIDARLVDVVRHHKGDAAVPDAAPGRRLAVLRGRRRRRGRGVRRRAARLAADSGTTAVRVVPPGPGRHRAVADPRGRRRPGRPHRRRARRPGPAGRTRPSRPSGSAATCAGSRRS